MLSADSSAFWGSDSTDISGKKTVDGWTAKLVFGDGSFLRSTSTSSIRLQIDLRNLGITLLGLSRNGLLEQNGSGYAGETG